MSENKIEFKINTDTSGAHLQLSSMSLLAAKSLVTLLESLTKIIELSTDSSNVKIQIIAGSATLIAVAPAPAIEAVYLGFNEITEHKSTNIELVEYWQTIQGLIKKNGLEYEANFYRDSVKTPVLEKIKSGRNFKAKITRNKIQKDTDLFFITGKLIEVGGKKPNIHIYLTEDEKYTVNCEERDAIVVNNFLYKPVYLSVWRTKKSNNTTEYSFCDFYVNNSDFIELQSFVNSFNRSNEVDALINLHKELKNYIDDGNFGKMKKFLRLFIHPTTDVSTLKTILVITKSVKDQGDISQLRMEIKSLLEAKIGPLV